MSTAKRLPLRSYANVLKLRLAMALRSSKISHYPIVAYIEPTSFCNLRCPSCPTGTRMGIREEKAISFERFRELVDELSPYLLILYFYNFGEPLLHKDSIKMIRYASQKGILIRASSNLSVKLSDERALELVKSGLHSLKVGLDGIDQKTYAQYRRRGCFELVVSNVEKIVKYKKQENSKTPYLSVAYHVFKHNEDTIADAKILADRIGIDSFSPAPAFLPPDSEGMGIEAPSDKSLRMFDHLKASFANEKTCSWLYGAVVHNPNGTVSPCCGISHEEDDFCAWPSGKNIRSVMNDPHYILARNIIKNKNIKNYSFRADDGMCFTHPEFDRSEEVICAKCPTPYHWGRIKSDMLTSVVELYKDFKKAGFRKKLYLGFCYLLMGMPFLYDGLRNIIGGNKDIIAKLKNV